MIEVVELPAFPQGQSQLSQPDLRNSIMSPQIDGRMEIRDGTIFAAKLVIGNQTWSHNLVWSATDYNTMAWTSGSLQFANGQTYSIASGNTGNIAAATYVYLDLDISTTVLQTSTSYADAIGDKKILLAIASPASDTNGYVLITPLGAEGTTIDGAKIVTGRIQSIDGLTYFDLNDKRIVMSDGTNPRLLIGDDS